MSGPINKDIASKIKGDRDFYNEALMFFAAKRAGTLAKELCTRLLSVDVSRQLVSLVRVDIIIMKLLATRRGD